MDAHAIRRKIRAKRLGIALQDARRLAGRKPQECEEALGIPAKTLRAYERGTRSPSVPELAALAYFYQVPMEHFWGTEIRSDDPLPLSPEQIQTLMEEYHRTIAARLKAAREAKGLTLRELARKTGLSTAKLRKYEEGAQPVPVPDLEVLASELDLSLNALFREAPGPIGEWIRYQQRLQGFLSLSEDLQDFVSKPVNRPYLEIAQRLSQLPVERLRAVAEGLLEITL